MPGRNVAEGASPGVFRTWGCPADLNGDWIVDEIDFGIFAASYNQLVPDVDALVGATGSGNSSGGAMEWGPGWNGYWYDPATGLWLSRNRWYDPVGGRWITRDPAGYVDGLSLYLYVKGNPFLFRDPSGLEAMCTKEWHDRAPREVFEPGGKRRFSHIDISEKEYGLIMDKPDHRGGKSTGTPSNKATHDKYNQHWKDWIDRQETAGKSITKEGILEHINEIQSSANDEYADFRQWLGKGAQAEHSHSDWLKMSVEYREEWFAKKTEAAKAALTGTAKEIAVAGTPKHAGTIMRRAGKTLKALGCIGVGYSLAMEGNAVYAGEKSVAAAVHDTINAVYTVEDGNAFAETVNSYWDNAKHNGRARVQKMDSNRHQPNNGPLEEERIR